MAYEQKPNSYTLFKNEKKTAPNHPDYTGTFKDENGKVWRIAGWIKDGKKGKFISGTVDENKQKTESGGLPF